MGEITEEFLNELKKKFKKRYAANKRIQELIKKLESNNASCNDAFEYAKEVGDLMKVILHENITDEILKKGYLGYKEALRLFNSVLKNDYELINLYCQSAFTQVNKAAGINLKGVNIKYDEGRTERIARRASNDLYENVQSVTEEAVLANAKAYYDMSVKENARVQYKAGLNPKIIRTASGKTCEWCQALAGTYDYNSTINSDVFKRHANCDCLVVYSPEKGSYQNVHAQNTWYNSEEYKAAKAKRINYAENKRR